MKEVQEKAIKLLNEDKSVSKNPQRAFMKQYIVDVLCDFCRQSEAFAQAVVSDGKSVSACIEAIKLDNSRYLSDVDAYKQAVQYYFPEAMIHNTLQIVIPQKSQTSAKILNLSFADLLKGGASK